MKVQNIQPTPNPNAFKFLLDQQILDGSRDYPDVNAARQDPLAQAIFAVPGTESVYYSADFVTVTMDAAADWRTVAEQVTGILESHHIDAVPTAGDGDAAGTAEPKLPEGADLELLQKINTLLDDRVRPALAGDGGGLEILGLEGKTVTIRYQGACGSCPSSIQGTLIAIQNLLQSEVDAELAVVPA